MVIEILKKEIVLIIVLIFILSNGTSVFGLESEYNNLQRVAKPIVESDIKFLNLTFFFSYPKIVVDGGNIWVYVNETDLNMMISGKPVLPVNITELEFEFGTKIKSIEYKHSTPIIINLTGRLAHASKSMYDKIPSDNFDSNNSESSDPFPSDWISYHTSGGLSHGFHRTFLINRVYPVRHYPDDNQLRFIENITVIKY